MQSPTLPPRGSVIVPVYNGAATIERCLNALAQQTAPAADYEILVVDDGSTDETAQVVRRWQVSHPALHTRLVQQANAGPAAARNHGARAAQAPVLLFTDADCAPTPTWVATLLAAFEHKAGGSPAESPAVESPVVGAKGTYLSEQTALVPRFVQAEYEDRYTRMTPHGAIDFIDTYSAAYRRDVFLENGGFDTIFTTASVEDQELSFRLAQKGHHLIFVPEAKVVHLHDGNAGDYWRRKFYIGYWKALLVRWHPERIVQDSHTPQTLKLQMALVCGMAGLFIGLPLLLILAVAWPLLGWLPSVAGLAILGALLAFLLSAAGFERKLAQRSPELAAAGLPMLFVRAAALSSGYIAGLIHFAGTLPGQRQPVIPGWKQFVKRGVDILGALVGLLLSLPLIAVAALAIKLDSRGPIFYRQTRIGQDGARFRIIKLRTMVRDAEERLHELVDLSQLAEPVFKLQDDPRITRAGRLLRRASVDETPQFLNVLRGEMSLVGPRPEEEAIVALYNSEQRRRLAVKPGMTGPMQINGRGDLTLAARLQLELEYIDCYSLRHDFLILLQTLPAIYHGRGAR